MHSKFSKIQTVFLTLAVLFTSVLVPNQVQALSLIHISEPTRR